VDGQGRRPRRGRPRPAAVSHEGDGAHPVEARLWERLQGLPGREREALRRRVETAERERALLHRTRPGARPTPHPIALTPFLVPRRLLPALAELARGVHRFQAKAPELYRAGALGFRELCPLDATTEAWLFGYQRPAGDHDLMIRLDVGLAADGRVALYETNSTALAGLFNHATGVEILQGLVYPRLLTRAERRGLGPPPDLLAFVFDWVAETAHRLGLPGRRLGVAFVEPAGPGEGYSELPAITRYFGARGVRASTGDPRQLHLDRDGVVLKGAPVDLVYRDVAFQDLGDPPAAGRRLAGFRALLERQAVVPGFSAEFDHKGLLECLTSPAYQRFFSARERARFRAAVPWTRVLRARRTEGPGGEGIDLPRYVSKARDRLLIKPNRGSGGEGVVLGWTVPPARWERAIERALREPGRWVVQERVEAARRPMVYLQDGALHFAPCYASLGLFYVRERLGLHCRVSRVEVVNVGRGGALACAFVARG